MPHICAVRATGASQKWCGRDDGFKHGTMDDSVAAEALMVRTIKRLNEAKDDAKAAAVCQSSN